MKILMAILCEDYFFANQILTYYVFRMLGCENWMTQPF